MQKAWLIINILLQIPVFSQIGGQTDTIRIYENKSGVGIKIYYRAWFFRTGSYSYCGHCMTHQDSIVMEDRNAHYFKVYDDKDHLLLSGTRAKGNTELTGDIIFYRKNGIILKIEHWDNSAYKDSCGNLYMINDAPGKEGNAKYYRKNGSIKKEVDRLFILRAGECDNYKLKQRIRKYRRDGRVYSDKLKKNHW
jgi:hypothetical protein